jgi:CHAT domain-containing protein
VIIPDGPLYYLPFEVLISGDRRPASGNTARIDFRQLPYLVNRFEISYALSGMLFCEAQSATEVKRGAPLSFVGFAPVTEESHGNVTRSGMSGGSTGREPGVFVPALDRSRFSVLPHSESEVRGIAEDFIAAGKIGTYIAGSGATKADFAAHAARYSIVHIATHCFIDEDHPSASTLLFAPGPEPSPGGDNLLYAGETYNLRLNADLVTLSSCESGVGRLVRGEGLMAMTRGFFYAGARNVVCSLWKVYDNHADQLMRGFYRHVLEGREFSSALREAKLAMIRNRITAHPFKWAGFTLIGQ